jgi:hypothetical protein
MSCNKDVRWFHISLLLEIETIYCLLHLLTSPKSQLVASMMSLAGVACEFLLPGGGVDMPSDKSSCAGS